MTDRWTLHFLGTGAAHAIELGNASAVLERNGEPLLLIDCGPDCVRRCVDAYGKPPSAVFLTHLHMDHVGGLEQMFTRVWFDPEWRGRVHLYVHAGLLPLLQGRVADYPNVLAEGGANFWEAFRLVPCSRGFWHAGLWFDVFATRHHRPGTSFGLALPGSFVWTGDTGPFRKCWMCMRRVASLWRTIAAWSAILRTPASTMSSASTLRICANGCCCTTTAAWPTASGWKRAGSISRGRAT